MRHQSSHDLPFDETDEATSGQGATLESLLFAPSLGNDVDALLDVDAPDTLGATDGISDASRLPTVGPRWKPLLDREQEAAIGKDILEGRLHLAAALSTIPAAIERFLEGLDQARASARPFTDVLLAPAVHRRTAASHDSELSLADLESLWARLAMARERGEATDALRERMARCFVAIEPGCVILSEALDHCIDLDRRGAARAAGIERDVLRSACADARRARARLFQAREHLVESNLRLAYYMANKLKGHGLDIDDLVQEAFIGLIRAAEKFDHRLGYKFSTYACQWIWQSITKSLADSSRTVRVPAHTHDALVRIKKVSRTLRHSLDREPSPEEVVEASGLDKATVARALEAARRPASLDTPILDGTTTLHAVIPDPRSDRLAEITHDHRLAARIRAELAALPVREAAIIRLRFGVDGVEPMTLDEIGKLHGITRERTRQLQSRALKRLRGLLGDDALAGLG